MSQRSLTPATTSHATDTVTQERANTRVEFGFSRTTCGCALCVENCKHIPGYLIPDDVERIAKTLGYASVGEFAAECLLASPGATVMSAEGLIFQIPTLVPRRKTEDGSCIFLGADNRCRIHEVAPFGCAFFDHAQSDGEANRRSSRGLQEVARHWAAHAGTSAYTVLWQLLHAAGYRAMPAHVARAKMKEVMERRVSPAADHAA